MDDIVLHNHPLELLQWMYDNGGEGCTDRAFDRAAGNGNLDVLKWLLSKGLSWTTRGIDQAAGNGHLHVVKFLLEVNRSGGFAHTAFTSAVANNHLEVAKYLFEYWRGDPAGLSIDSVASNGGLEMLKWLQISCPDAECSVRAMNSAATIGHLEVVKFLHDNRSEGCTAEAMDRAAKNGHLEVVKWLHLYRTEGCTTDAMDYAHDLEMLQWLGENRHEGFTQSALLNGCERGDIRVLMWLYDHTPADMWKPDLAPICATFGHDEALEWFADTFPTFVKARELLAFRGGAKWWATSWLNQQAGA